MTQHIINPNPSRLQPTSTISFEILFRGVIGLPRSLFLILLKITFDLLILLFAVFPIAVTLTIFLPSILTEELHQHGDRSTHYEIEETEYHKRLSRTHLLEKRFNMSKKHIFAFKDTPLQSVDDANITLVHVL